MSDYREQPEQRPSAASRFLDGAMDMGSRFAQQRAQMFAKQQLQKLAVKGAVKAGFSAFMAGAGPYVIAAIVVFAVLFIGVDAVINGSLALPGTGGGGSGPSARSQKFMEMIKTVRKSPTGQPNTRLIYQTNEEFRGLPNGDFEYFVTISLPSSIASATIKNVTDTITQTTEEAQRQIASINAYKDVEGNDTTLVDQVLTTANPSVSFAYSYSFSDHSSGQYDDSILKNSLSVTFELVNSSGEVKTYTESVNANILIGDYPQIDKCWPTDGQISQLPVAPHATMNASRQAIDIGAYVIMNAGLPLPKIYASHEGIAQTQPAGTTGACYSHLYGNCVIVTSPEGFSTIYAHMSEILIEDGQIEKGALLGIVGTTGYSTGEHLHYELYRGGPINEIVPPYSYKERVYESCSI